MPKLDLGLPSYDSLFSTEEERQEANTKKVMTIPINKIKDFEGHPFHVTMDEDMAKLIDSIKENDMLMPALVRPKPDGTYELFKQSASDSNTFIQIPTLGKKQVLEYDINAEGTVSSIFFLNNPKVNHYNDKANKLERLKGMNKTIKDFNSYVNAKLALGKRDSTNPNGIVYKCD